MLMHYFAFRFVISNKESICNNLKDSHKSLELDLENQKIIYKKLQDSVNDHTKHFNEVAKNLN